MVVLDVGCGSRPKGDVNVDFFRGGMNRQEADQDVGEFLNPKAIPNFVVASAEFLPFRSDIFDVAFSSHTIEHVHNPFKMLAELVRVSKRQIVVKCPHRQGSGAHRPFHVSYLDEEWFNSAAVKLGVKAKSFVSVFDDGPLSSRLFQGSPRPMRRLYSRNLFYRVVRKVERRLFSGAKLPLEVETHLVKQVLPAYDEVVFVVVYNDAEIFEKCFSSGVGVKNAQVIGFDNKPNFGLAFAYNCLAQSLLDRNVWVVFCHQDFILNESLERRLRGLNKFGVYGVIGSRLGTVGLLGKIMQTDGSFVGTKLVEPAPVDCLDEMCLIIHTEAIRRGLRFDNLFTFHYYGADICMQAHKLGFDVLAIQVDCQHKSHTLSGAINSQCYRDLRGEFKVKWQTQLPVVTTTGLIKP